MREVRVGGAPGDRGLLFFGGGGVGGGCVAVAGVKGRAEALGALARGECHRVSGLAGSGSRVGEVGGWVEAWVS